MAIKWLGTKKIKLASIVTPKGFAARKKLPHVADLAESIKRGGVISLPVVQDRPRKLIAGGDRLAALMLLKTVAHEVRIVRGTPQELEELMLEENLLRRRSDDYGGMVKRLVELRTGDIEAAELVAERVAVVAAEEAKAAAAEAVVAPPPPEEPRPVGRPKTAKGKAREEVAKAMGKTPEAVRSAEKRANAKEHRHAFTQSMGTLCKCGERAPADGGGAAIEAPRELSPAEHMKAARSALRRVEGLLRRATVDLVEGVEGNSPGAVLTAPIRGALAELLESVGAAIGRIDTGPVPANPAPPKADKPPTGNRRLRVELDDGTVFQGE